MERRIGDGAIWRALGVLMLAVGLASGAQAQEVVAGETAVVAEAVDPDGSAGREALAKLSKEKQASYAFEGDARRAQLAGVADRYMELSRSAEHRRDERAEAAFRGGELYRTARRIDAARAAFESAASLGPGTEGEVFAARAWLELGHIARRADDPDGALASYAVVAERFAAHTRPAAHAWTWRSKVCVADGRLDDASTAVRAFLERFAASYPVEGIRNAERVARELVSAGHASDAVALKTHTEAVIEAARASWADDEEAVAEALGDFAVTSNAETR